MMSLDVQVEPAHCTRCGACAALCPEVFDVTGKASRVARQPSPNEHVFAPRRALDLPDGCDPRKRR